jgi:hypothetical protein
MVYVLLNGMKNILSGISQSMMTSGSTFVDCQKSWTVEKCFHLLFSLEHRNILLTTISTARLFFGGGAVAGDQHTLAIPTG